MAAEPDLSPEQNQALRDALQHFMETGNDHEPFSQKEIASKLAVSQQNISAFLTGKTGVGRKVATKIAALIGRHLDEFLVDFGPVGTPPAASAQGGGSGAPGMPRTGAASLRRAPKVHLRSFPVETGESGASLKRALGLAFSPKERGHEVDDIAVVLGQVGGHGVSGTSDAVLDDVATVLLDAAAMMRKGAMPVTPADFTLAVALAAVMDGHPLEDLANRVDPPDDDPPDASPAASPDPGRIAAGPVRPLPGREPRYDFGDTDDTSDIPF